MKLFFVFFHLIFFPNHAQESVPNKVEVITVTAEKHIRSLDKTTSSIVVITEEEIEKSQKISLNDLLQEKSGIYLNSNGSFGKTSSLFMRGADSSFTLVVVDGVEYSDKSSVGGAPLYEYLSLNNIKQIEILKGAQSVLYGSDAVAGVIKITTKDAGEVDGQLTIGYGSHDDKLMAANSQGRGEHFDYSLGLMMRDSEGISSYNQNRQVMAEKDGYSNLTGQMKLEKKIRDHRFQFNVLGIKAKSNFDSASADLTQNLAKDDQFLISTIYDRTISNYFSPKFSFSQNRSDRLSTTYNSFSSNTDINHLVAKTNKYELENMSSFDTLTMLQGLEFEDVKASISSLENKKTHKSYAAYLNLQKEWTKFDLQMGARLTEERNYNTQLVWKLGGLYELLTSTSLKMNMATGFKSPSLYQLHSSSGDENLRPTKSNAYDLGIIHYFPALKLELSYFHNVYRNLIDYDSSVSKYANTFKSETSGFEMIFQGDLESISYGGNATFQKAINKSRGNVGAYLPRRPRRQYSLYIEKKFQNLSIAADGRYIGQRENSDFDNIVLSSYFTADLRGSYQFSESSKLLLLLGNILDKDYEQIHGYGSLGRTWQLKWKGRL